MKAKPISVIRLHKSNPHYRTKVEATVFILQYRGQHPRRYTAIMVILVTMFSVRDVINVYFIYV